MHFNPKVAFTRVENRRDPKTGVYLHHGAPWDVDYTKVTGYAPGEIHLDDGNTYLVEEDYEQIKKRIDDKEKEKELYEANLRLLELLGLAGPPNGANDDE